MTCEEPRREIQTCSCGAAYRWHAVCGWPTQEGPDIGFRVAQLLVVGDVDGDGHVDVRDLLVLAGTWAKAAGDPGFDPACDLNNDGSVNVIDLLILADNWGT